MKGFLIVGEGFNSQGGNVWMGRGGGSYAMAFPFQDTSGGNKVSD